MTTPPPISDAERVERIRQDGEDRRFAADAAFRGNDAFTTWTKRADDVYTWLRGRSSTQPASLEVTPGVPQPEGTPSQ
jgi:hypothetical protein